jgi:predicted MFS family arabinose efflux permease
MPIGALIGGFVAFEFGLRAPFLVGGSIILAGLLLFGRALTPARIARAMAAASPVSPT